MPSTSYAWNRILTPYGSFLATTAAVAFLMSWVASQPVMGALCVLLLFAWCFYSLILWALQDTKGQIEFVRWNLRRMFAVTGCIAVMSGAIVHHWPLKWRFLASQAELDEFADRLEGGLQMPNRSAVGFFVINKAEMRGHMPCLWTDPDPAGYSGFVRCTPEQAKSFNLWWDEPMNARWQLIIED